MFKMKKQMIGAVSALGVAAVLIGGNGVLSAYAMNEDQTPNVHVTGQFSPSSGTELDSSISKVQISELEESPLMAELRTSQDMDKYKAVAIAKKALEDKFGVSLNDTYASPIYTTLEKKKGTYYFVSFIPLEVVQAGKMKTADYDIFIANVNSKTGEVVSADKNPTASGDVSHPDFTQG